MITTSEMVILYENWRCYSVCTVGFLLFWFDTRGWLSVGLLFFCFARWDETGLAVHEGDDWVMWRESCIPDEWGRKGELVYENDK
jgi:hypothetical protein